MTRGRRDADGILRARFEREVLPHVDAAFRVALELVKDRSAAEDLAQEAMLKAFSCFASYEEGTRPKAWLMTIVRNLAIDRHRRQKVRPIELSLIEGAVGVSSGADPALAGAAVTPLAVHGAYDLAALDARVRDAFDDEVAHALEALAPEHRQALLLCDVEELSYQDIAQVLDCPIGTVRSRIARARERMREVLADHPSAAEVAR